MGTLKHKRILIVDDEEADRTLLSTYLARHGCLPLYAYDGLDGIEKARVLQPDAILMDASMPRCGGHDACKVVTQDPRTRDIPVIFISALNTPEHRVRGLLAGAVDYIEKPFDFNEVKLRLLIHLRNSSVTPKRPDNAEQEPVVANNRHLIVFHTTRSHLLKSLHVTPLMKDLEKHSGTNSKHLNMAFRKCAGVTVYEYLREERMREARILLQQTDLAVQDIAPQVGFTDSANFATAFKERFGLTPREFRRAHN